ncbi:DUF3365 domain-containing protein [Algoriphagus halophytocola]|uniref:DUF3365 domain-containing protein n=1 Tax=Algoriphagus halophytocola TaxID=2991499 RepID=A0ABY6MD81_9BACT|nr:MULTISPECIES: DUF3365 domain-containing protein [unclassified Algoriphagus]UZD21319.1 DUF3365 domain-containing protein [Algoriphagus sp. TR-M5]WBL42530.1 DUF3365 domain-containing protein [Algoriphagus sp. TR-M9]
MKASLSIIIVFVIAISGCGPRERVSKEVFEAVNKNMEVKKLSEVEITEEAMIWGDSITQAAQAALMGQLKNAVADQGPDGAVEFCNANATPIVKELSEQFGVEIRRVSTRARNPKDLPDEAEFPILDAYAYNSENDIPNEPNIQKTQNAQALLYTKAIVIPNGFCLSCHGNPETEISKSTLEKLNALYPNDLAKGHKIGDLRGMWAVRIPTKMIVGRL